MAILNALLRTTTTACNGVRRLGGATAAALAGGALLSAPGTAQEPDVNPIITQSTAQDFTPSSSNPGDIEAGDVLVIFFQMSSSPIFIRDASATAGEPALEQAVPVFSGMSVDLDLSPLGSDAVIDGFTSSLTLPNCNGTGAPIGSNSPQWSNMSVGEFFEVGDFLGGRSCNVSTAIKLPDDLAPGDYTLSFSDLTGVETITSYWMNFSGEVIFIVGGTGSTPFSTAVNDVTFIASSFLPC